jgi:flagellar capping protein FliD
VAIIKIKASITERGNIKIMNSEQEEMWEKLKTPHDNSFEASYARMQRSYKRLEKAINRLEEVMSENNKPLWRRMSENNKPLWRKILGL